MILALCHFFEKDPAELDLARALTEKELIMIEEILKNRTVDRRQALAIVTLPAFKGVDLSSLSKPLVSPEQFLNTCRASIDACWHLLVHDGRVLADCILMECIPTLSSLATDSWACQHQAASLAVEARIIRMNIATHELNFARREALGSEAIDIAEKSRDDNLHAMALGWHGDTYKHCYRQPETAIAIFNDALKCGDTISSLNKSDIYMGLASAYAQGKNAKLARKYAEFAQMTMPDSPEQDPFYRCISMGQSELDQREGRIYLNLEEYFPKKGYAQKAYDAFLKSTSKQAMSVGDRGMALIYAADAARAIGKLDEYLKCLGEGLTIAIQINSKKRKDEARKVLNKVPDKWKHEQRYKKLVKMF
jgi:tetratricopeptide (TPR) repeat protein